MRPRSLLVPALILFSGAAAAGMYDSPWAIVEAAQPSTARDEFRPAITQVDGKSTRNPRRTDPIAPGKHTVRVRFETARVNQSEAEVARDLEMDLEPCMLYRIAAKRIETTQWKPVVYSEPLGECKKKFAKK
jgi:hypothetical protein